MDSDWIGAVRLFSNELPLAEPVDDVTEQFPLEKYQKSLKSAERGMWTSGSHGAVTQTAWLSRPGTLLVSTFDGAILQLTQNLLDESPQSASNADAKAPAGAKASAKEAAKDKKSTPTFSKVIYRHTDAVRHLKIIDNDGGVPRVVTASVSGLLTALDLAGGKVSVISSKKASFQPCSSLVNHSAGLAASFGDNVIHILDSNLNTTHKIQCIATEDDLITSIAASQNNSNLLAAGTIDQHLCLIDVRNTSAPISIIETGGAIRACSFNNASSLISTASDDGYVQVFDIASSTINPTPIYSFKHADRVTSVAWTSEAGEIVSTSFDGLALRHKVSV